MKNYEATIIGAVFDKNYEFQDILNIGVSHSPKETGDLMMCELWRLIEDFEPHKITVEESRSLYDEPITVVICGDDIYHYYILLKEQMEED